MDTLTSALNICRLIALSKSQQAVHLGATPKIRPPKAPQRSWIHMKSMRNCGRYLQFRFLKWLLNPRGNFHSKTGELVQGLFFILMYLNFDIGVKHPILL